jgi:histidine ammonia-lyase
VLALEGLLGSIRAFDARAMAVRPHAGQVRVARALLALTGGSKIVASHADCDRIQDPVFLALRAAGRRARRSTRSSTRAGSSSAR